MIIAWMSFSSIGMIIARYFKSMLPGLKPCDLQFWFIIHKPLMTSIPIISISSLVIILWHSNWQWASLSNSILAFVHSIFGIFTIGISIIQVICKQY